jgi:hypothetical protein
MMKQSAAMVENCKVDECHKRELVAEIQRLGKLCDLYAEFIVERNLWEVYGEWCAAPRNTK